MKKIIAWAILVLFLVGIFAMLIWDIRSDDKSWGETILAILLLIIAGAGISMLLDWVINTIRR
jgi:hypothetical protein